MKYKLLKDTPAHKAGTICTQGLSNGENMRLIYPLNSVNSICRTEDVTNEWFRPYLFTTENGVDIYRMDTYYIIEEEGVSSNITAFSLGPYADNIKRFSTKEAAQKYLDSLNVPEYIECMEWDGSYCKVGEVYPVSSYNGTDYIIKTPHCKYTVYAPKKQFKPATKEEYEAQFVKYNVGDWVIASIGDTQYIGRYTETVAGGVKMTEWCPLCKMSIEKVECHGAIGLWNQIDRLATHEEIETYLMLLAESKGFVKGVCFYGVDGAKMNEPIEIGKNWDIYFHPYLSGLYCDDSWIYKDGKWATIAKKPVEPKAEYFYYHTSGTFDVEFTGKVTDVSINDNKVRINYTT